MSHSSAPAKPISAPMSAQATGPLSGAVTVPGDKSISHRSLIFGALNVGRTQVSGLLEGEDVLGTAAALRALGATITRCADGVWTVDGVGVGGFAEPDHVLDFGNSGTTARLMCGAMATHDMVVTMTGDGSLRRRPMGRIADPLAMMGARFLLREGGRFPGALRGAPQAIPIRYELPVASAQVKSAVLLAGLNAPGETTVVEAAPTRDHTETMLRAFGVQVEITATTTSVTPVNPRPRVGICTSSRWTPDEFSVTDVPPRRSSSNSASSSTSFDNLPLMMNCLSLPRAVPDCPPRSPFTPAC
mgnify:CR=1 FL=1